MRYLTCFVLALALSASGCGGGPCTGSLSDYCARIGGCPTYQELFEEIAASDYVSTGTCLGYRYIMDGRSLLKRIYFFDETGTLKAAQFLDDVPTFCDGSSYLISYGPVPSCDADECGRFWCEEGHWLRP